MTTEIVLQIFIGINANYLSLKLYLQRHALDGAILLKIGQVSRDEKVPPFQVKKK